MGLSNFWFRFVVIIVWCILYIISSDTLFCNLFLGFVVDGLNFTGIHNFVDLLPREPIESHFFLHRSLTFSYIGHTYIGKVTTFLIGDSLSQNSIL